MLLATTDRLNSNARRTLERQEKRTEWLLRSQLEDANVAWPASYEALRRELRGEAKYPARPTPRPDQRDAIKKVVAGLRDGTSDDPRRGQLIMACGTGKTLTAHWVVERLRSRRTICFVPSISLLNQTMGVWLGNERRKGVAYLPVCSDATVWKDKDSSEDMRPQELGVPVSTKPEEIAAFLRRHPGDVIVFATYQSSPKIADALALVDSAAGFDLVVADEAHRCAGTADSVYATSAGSFGRPRWPGVCRDFRRTSA